MHRDARVQPDSFDADSNTIEIVWTTGASVRRYSWWDGEEYDEVLSLEPGAVRLERLNAGAPFVDTHSTYCLDNVIGSVVPGTAKIEDGRGVATILLSAAPGVADTVQKIREGVIRNISVGYWLHKVVKTEADDGSVARHEVVDWEPLEISAVPVPADAGSQIRSAEGEEGEAMTRSSCLIVTRSPASRPNTPATSETPMASRTPKTAAPKGNRTAKTTDVEAEKKRKAEERKAALRAAARDEDEAETESEDEERDEDTEEERNEDESENGDGGSDDERDGDDEEDEERSEDGDEEDEGERSATTAAARRAAEAAVKAERKRMASITEMAERAGLPKMGRKHIDQGTSAKRFGELVLERMLKNQEKRGNTTFAGNGSEEISRERSSGRQGRDQRDLSEGEAHWRRVAGKPAKAA
ncbi:UNVERIFIED_CONTAM: HK97 family phage prohead protease [Methylobacteriaceae bacterium AG10]|nr:HK97 family phage prohead protease [Methylobacteriaceae bacterium AG10]